MDCGVRVWVLFIRSLHIYSTVLNMKYMINIDVTIIGGYMEAVFISGVWVKDIIIID